MNNGTFAATTYGDARSNQPSSTFAECERRDAAARELAVKTWTVPGTQLADIGIDALADVVTAVSGEASNKGEL
jgi:hypothetical protein